MVRELLAFCNLLLKARLMAWPCCKPPFVTLARNKDCSLQLVSDTVCCLAQHYLVNRQLDLSEHCVTLCVQVHLLFPAFSLTFLTGQLTSSGAEVVDVILQSVLQFVVLY